MQGTQLAIQEQMVSWKEKNTWHNITIHCGSFLGGGEGLFYFSARKVRSTKILHGRKKVYKTLIRYN